MGISPYYPWDKWFDGNQHTIVRGQDFMCAVSSMVAQLYTKAKTRGIKITVKPKGNSITLARKPVLFAVAQDYYLVEEWILKHRATIGLESDRRGLTFGRLVENMLDDALDSYRNQSDELVALLAEDMREEDHGTPSLRAS